MSEKDRTEVGMIGDEVSECSKVKFQDQCVFLNLSKLSKLGLESCLSKAFPALATTTARNIPNGAGAEFLGSIPTYLYQLLSDDGHVAVSWMLAFGPSLAEPIIENLYVCVWE